MVEVLEDLAADGVTHLVIAGLVHAERDAVQDDHQHTDPLETSGQELRTNSYRNM